jgi:hypothetical protein
MKKVNVEIKGVAPLLQHRFPIEEHGENVSKQKNKVYNPKEEAEKSMYKNGKGVYQPSEHIFGALVKAGVYFKYEGKKTYKDIIKAGIIIEPNEIPLLNENKKYNKYDEIDARPVVVNRARVVRWRPKFNNWKLKFKITILNKDEISVEVLKEILEYSGKLGLGDYRPRFGRYMVTNFKICK